MPITTQVFTTGPCTLPDVGTLRYNGCVFSPLFESSISGNAVQDNARRTIKYMEYSISVEGYVTLIAGATSINSTMTTLRRLLEQEGAPLFYSGRGFDLDVNAITGTRGFSGSDVAWGPVPIVLEFQPLGGGLSAKVRWRCIVRIADQITPSTPGKMTIPILQFNNESAVSYDEDGYSSLSVNGTLEIPLTRPPVANSRQSIHTVDDFRSQIDDRIMDGIDLSRFYIRRREFNVSRDKRTMEWSIVAEEKPYMDSPPDCTIARGSYTVRPAKIGMGLCTWLCTLHCTYTVRADRLRRHAWFAFLALLQLRMRYSDLGNIPGNNKQNPSRPPTIPQIGVGLAFDPAQTIIWWRQYLKRLKDNKSRKAWLIDFSFGEGIHRDSKTVSFSATWRMVTTISHVLIASGLWKKMPERNPDGSNIWATSMRPIMGSQSWLPNKLDPAMDIIVDFGGG